MSSNQIAIKVQNLSKCYHIYSQPQDRLKQAVFPRLQKLTRRLPQNYYKEFWALQDISFEIKKGETVGIIGRNGSGKSTLLQLICGTLTPTIGTVQTDGRIAALLELGSGFNMEFTGRENIYLNGAVLGLSKEEIDSRFSDIAAFADIGDFIERPVKTYSSGMVVRLAFSVQATIDPDILVVDEALAVGDEKFQRKCFSRLEELKSKGTAILFVSHSGSQVVDLCDAALLLERGTRLMYTSPLTAVRAYQKMIYAPPDRQAALAQEYRISDQLSEDAPHAEQLKSVSDFSANHIKSQAESYKKKVEPAELESNTIGNHQEDFFDPGLVPDTTISYPLQGAEISSFRILSLDGNPVNTLIPGENYQFEVAGNILADRGDVYIGIHIRSISGTVITGQRYPEEGRYIESVRRGQKFCITFQFSMALLPGVYFIGGGLWSINEPLCLHRIMDALMFRVQSKSKQNAFGICDLISSPVDVKIS